jgi:hypothetical protein
LSCRLCSGSQKKFLHLKYKIPFVIWNWMRQCFLNCLSKPVWWKIHALVFAFVEIHRGLNMNVYYYNYSSLGWNHPKEWIVRMIWFLGVDMMNAELAFASISAPLWIIVLLGRHASAEKAICWTPINCNELNDETQMSIAILKSATADFVYKAGDAFEK